VLTQFLFAPTMTIRPFSQDELDDIYAFAVDLGRKAGKLLMERVEQRISGANGASNTFEEKENAVDIVTQTDEGKPAGATDQVFRATMSLISFGRR
jgi:hypothetical protein